QGETLSAANLARYENNGQPVYADRGLAMAVNLGLRADAIRLTADPSGAAASMLELRGVDAYLPLGSVDQPLTISTVQFAQIQRGTWKNPTYLPATTQLRMEIAGLPQDVAQAPQGNILSSRWPLVIRTMKKSLPVVKTFTCVTPVATLLILSRM